MCKIIHVQNCELKLVGSCRVDLYFPQVPLILHVLKWFLFNLLYVPDNLERLIFVLILVVFKDVVVICQKVWLGFIVLLLST